MIMRNSKMASFLVVLAALFAVSQANCNTACPQSFKSNLNCSFSCSCDFGAFTDETISRTYACNFSNTGAAGFFFANISFQNGSLALDAISGVPSNTSTIYNNVTTSSGTLFAVAVNHATYSNISFLFNSSGNNENSSFHFTSHTIPCVPSNLVANGLSLTWTAPPATAEELSILDFHVLQNGVQAQGSRTSATSFTVAAFCGSAPFTVQYVLPAFGLTCPQSGTVSVTGSSPPQSPKGLVAGVANGTAASLNTWSPSWNASVDDGLCGSLNYTVVLTNNKQSPPQLTFDNSSYVVVDGVVHLVSPITVPGWDSLTTQTFRVYATSSAGGQSPSSAFSYFCPFLPAISLTSIAAGFSNSSQYKLFLTWTSGSCSYPTTPPGPEYLIHVSAPSGMQTSPTYGTAGSQTIYLPTAEQAVVTLSVATAAGTAWAVSAGLLFFLGYFLLLLS